MVDLTRETYVVLKSDRRTYVMSAKRIPLAGLNPFKRLPGFIADVPVAMLESGRYRVGLFKTVAGGSQVQFTNQYAVVE